MFVILVGSLTPSITYFEFCVVIPLGIIFM